MSTNNAVNVGLSGSTGTGSFVGSASPTFTGTLTFASPFTLGSTSVTSTGTQLNYLSGLTAVPITKVVTQVFSTAGTATYTPTTGMVYCIIECLGGGGAGGGAANSTGQGCGGGGGSGSYARKTATATTIGSSQTVTVGAGGTAGSAGNNPGGNGGDTSVGSICIGKGGTGGGGAAANSVGASGAGGIAGTGDITGTGSPGDAGMGVSILTLGIPKGQGGTGIWGSGGPEGYEAAGNGAPIFGSGGGGGSSVNSSGSVAGGAGSRGFVIVTEYVSA